MGEAENEPADHDPDPRNAGADPPPTVESLADLQAGLLDDEAAARLRRQVREDPDAEGVLRALNQVRRDVAAVAADPESAPEPPAEVTDRISTALRSAGPGGASGVASHAARPRIRPTRVAAGVAGVGAVLAAIGFGTAALLNEPEPAPSTPTTAMHITVSTPPMAIPLSAAEIVGLLGRTPDYGPLADPARRASCLGGLGYSSSTPVLGARPIEINARPGVLLVLPADSPAGLAVFAVALNCSAADTGLLASTQIPRP
ncbi:hypothetical protein AWC05_00170 [Mycobacterium florentinum]|uniref:Anti-sigma-M factor RsmA n=1 Tax=Mycobacterium florentinum TaxID=292462 RepID=A0A1X1ULS0_MYCFL|nr:hypothetical protein [Mycobacterium florentinum]MCV7410444.1 hypothetical protein [Mycobacterium florentinum]ORV57780.1 hypothetical protein AWC05_00170 [Mycobacterium florentinum]BBX79762.1 anti-sigma-M factor RsmA [Mycobacterium florentinum]